MKLPYITIIYWCYHKFITILQTIVIFKNRLQFPNILKVFEKIRKFRNFEKRAMQVLLYFRLAMSSTFLPWDRKLLLLTFDTLCRCRKLEFRPRRYENKFFITHLLNIWISIQVARVKSWIFNRKQGSWKHLIVSLFTLTTCEKNTAIITFLIIFFLKFSMLLSQLNSIYLWTPIYLILGCPWNNYRSHIKMSLTIFLNGFFQSHDFFLLTFVSYHS